VNVPCIRAGGCTERCNPSTLSVGCSKTREPTRVTTRTPAVGYNPGWVDPPVTALMPVSQYGRPPLAFRQLGSHCRRQCRQVESLCRHGTASAESLPARHGRAPIPFFLPAMPAISPHGNLPSAGTHPCREPIALLHAPHRALRRRRPGDTNTCTRTLYDYPTVRSGLQAPVARVFTA
jgi:hypothetical protein